MLGLLREDGLQQFSGSQLVVVLLVGRVEVGRQHQAVEDGGLGVLGVLGSDTFEPGLQSLGAGAVIELVDILEEDRERIDIVALPLAGEPCLACLLHQRRAVDQRLGRHVPGPAEWVVERGQGAQPMHHAAGTVRLQRAIEWRLDVLPSEGVVVRHRKVEFALRRSVASDLEMHGAQLAGCVVGLRVLRPHVLDTRPRGQERYGSAAFSCSSPGFPDWPLPPGAGRRFGAQLIRSVNATFACDMSSTRRAAHPVMRLEDRGAQT
jgi:hypothetical protein